MITKMAETSMASVSDFGQSSPLRVLLCPVVQTRIKLIQNYQNLLKPFTYRHFHEGLVLQFQLDLS